MFFLPSKLMATPRHFVSLSVCCFYLLLNFLFISATQSSASTATTSKLVLEHGYTISTVLDFNKKPGNINPLHLIPRPRLAEDLVLLDSARSTFYTLTFPVSQDTAVSVLAGNGKVGFADGDTKAAMFDHPRSFAVDSNGNVYVADRLNHAIRKITPSGVTTVAGGYNETEGKSDGPAQNASFSNDFYVTFVPGRCVLLISDRGNRLIRQMNLKQGDCVQVSHPGLGLLTVSIIGVLCSLAGLIAGFVVHLLRGSSSLDVEALPNCVGEANSDNLLRHHKRNC